MDRATVCRGTRDRHARTAVWRARAAIVALAALLGLVSAAGGAQARPRFGDSTWVAPSAPPDSLPPTSGPRVADPDRPRAWETALRTPFRIAFFPLRVVALGGGKAADVIGPRLFEPDPTRPPKHGVVPGAQLHLGGLTDLGGGPSLTAYDLPNRDGSLHLGTFLSTQDRRGAELRQILGEHRKVSFVLRGIYSFRPNRSFYGIGNDAARSDSSIYLLESSVLSGTLQLGTVPRRQLRVTGGYSSLSPRRGYFGSPHLEDVFTPAEAPFEHRNTRELTYGVGGDLAAIDDPRDPSRGVHGRVDLERNAGVRARDPDFDRFRFEGRAYVPVFSHARVLAARAVYAGVDPRGSTTVLPYYRLATNDDLTPFAGYPSNRYMDRRLVLARAEYRWVIASRVSALGFLERVEVAPFTSALTARAAHPTWGGGLRYAVRDRVLRAELGKSRDGFHARLLLGGDW